ncbi:MAG: hypothetical protein C4523_19330 [Myxococcales bacterium]|nr:MAG: hypothetical protein C4523_19330 [Myxococcales bacterium]
MTSPVADPLPLVAVGYDFRRASAARRSRLVLSAEEADELARKLIDAGMATGLVALNTCNRNEWIASTSTPAWTGEILRARLMKRLQGALGEEAVEPYVYIGRDAARHILAVSAGLESFIVGEHQIASQVHRAFDEARERGRSSVILNGFTPFTGRASRESLLSGVGDCSIRGVHDAAVRCLAARFDPKAPLNVVVAGTGEIGRRVVDGLRHQTRWKVIPCNRTVRAGGPADVQPLEKLPELLAASDMAVVCTAAFRKVLTPEELKALPRGKKLTVVDLGIPTQVDPACALVPGVELIDLDGLQESVHAKADEKNVDHIRAEIEQLIDDFARFCKERDMVRVLQTAQEQHERFSRRLIPSLIEEELPGLEEAARRRLAYRLRGLLREYTNSIFNSIHETIAEREHDRN